MKLETAAQILRGYCKSWEEGGAGHNGLTEAIRPVLKELERLQLLEQHAVEGEVTPGFWGKVAARLVRENARLQADAARWAYARDHLARTADVRMDGQNSYRFTPLYWGRGPTVDAAVDAEIASVAGSENLWGEEDASVRRKQDPGDKSGQPPKADAECSEQGEDGATHAD